MSKHTPAPSVSDKPLNLKPYRLFAVLPCTIFFVIGFVSGQVGYLFLGLLILPIALVTIGLDLYFLYKRLGKN
jgi:hypothetical protein